MKYKSITKICLYFFLATSLISQNVEEPPGSKTIIVKKGETLSAIAKEHLSNPSRWKELLKYNNVPNPNLIKPGMKLVIPDYLGKEPIAVTNLVVGRVDWKTGEGSQEWITLKKNHQLFPLDSIRTLKESKADLSIKGSGLVRIHPNSLVQIKYLQDQNATPSVNLRKGSLDAFVSKFFIQGKPRAGEKLQIITPSAVAAVRGTEFSVELDNGENSTISCYDGAVGVTAQEKTVEISKGYATFVKKGEAPGEPYKIPLPPEIKKE
ncbi:MAG: FecR domain-containing protein [Leptospira sp.]|nr:FecR domain-containing protein [Leptospira sp.]